MSDTAPTDDTYLAIIRGALSICRQYRPRLGGGQRGGYSLDEFQSLYQQVPFYAWFGLDSPLVYAAHKAAGGITSVYRQLGIACERLFRRILQDQLSLSEDDSRWSYDVPSTSKKVRTLTLDGRIPIAAVKNRACAERLSMWLSDASGRVKLPKRSASGLRGSVFEVRQGYKSADSKRQNADIANAANAYANRYLPCVVLLSNQIDGSIAERYVRAQWLLLRGTIQGGPLESSYVFLRDVVGYDLAAFFARNSGTLKVELEATLKALLG